MPSLLSLIIPTYNRCSYLERLLKQLVTMPQVPDEIIVVDDHSTDDTPRLVQGFVRRHARISYHVNKGQHQRDAKKTGLTYARGDYVGFLDDDIVLPDSNFFAKLQAQLRPTAVIQAKVILENMGKQNTTHEHFIDRIGGRPYPILELPGVNFNTGSRVRAIYPLIEFGNFWPKRVAEHMIDNNLVGDGYGESYASALRLHRAGIPVLFVPELVIRHPGAPTGGSNRFHKQPMLVGFTEFHEGYFTNMIYLHARYYPGWIWLWLPYYVGKAVVALCINHQWSNWYRYAIHPIGRSLYQHWIRREYA